MAKKKQINTTLNALELYQNLDKLLGPRRPVNLADRSRKFLDEQVICLTLKSVKKIHSDGQTEVVYPKELV